jgi:LacI family transcriptional regulator
VSQSTVSLVLRGGEHAKKITEPIRRRVMQAADEIGYKPNHSARSLRQSRTNLIGLATTLYTSYSLGTVQAARKAAADGGRQLVVLAAEDKGAELAALDQLARGSIDALVISPHHEETMQMALHIAGQGRPVVLSGGGTVPGRLPAVRLDLEQAGFLATDHLITRGHRRIAYLMPPTGAGDGRFVGYAAAHQEAKLSVRDAFVKCCAPTAEAGFATVQTLLQAGRSRPTAVFTYNEELAIGAISGITAMGLRVPEDVAIVGVGASAIAAYLRPPLSTVVLPSEEAGRLAVELAIKASLRRPAQAEEHVLPVKLVVRESSDLRRRPVRA